MYDLGDTVALGVDVADSAGVATNAATIALTITLPDGTTATPTPTNPSTGRYAYDYVPVQAGRHTVRWVATGPNVAFTDVFNVRESDDASLFSLAVAKDYLNIAATDTDVDEELRRHIATTTAVVERIVGPVARRTIVETHSGSGTSVIVLKNPPIISITSVTENGEAVESSGWSLSDEGILTRVSGYTPLSWKCGVNNIVITEVVGRVVVKPNILEGAQELLRINWRPQQGGNYSPYDAASSDQQRGPQYGVERLGFFVPHAVMRRLAVDAF